MTVTLPPCTLDHDDPDTIPKVLCVRCNPRPTDLMTPAERAAYYAAHPTVTPDYRGGNVEERLLRERETRARIEAERKEKRDASRVAFLERMSREGKTYDRKAKLWLPTGKNVGHPGDADRETAVQGGDTGAELRRP